jgi:hypothetical protein
MTHNPSPQFVIESASAVEPGVLSLSFADGYSARVDISRTISRRAFFAPLRDWALFQTVTIDEWSRGVIFGMNEDFGFASDNLRALSLRQKGEYSHEDIITWMDRHGMTLDQAAAALGISRRMLAYYRSGEKFVPRTVGLALLGWESTRNRRPVPLVPRFG